MNAQEILAQVDRIITEVDLVLYEWQEAVDMMSFIGVNATFELWTNDHPPRLVTKDVLSQAAGKELRVMNYLGGGKPVQIGTAVIDENGMIQATITEDVPELRPVRHFSVSTRGKMIPHYKPEPVVQALSHYTMHKDGSVTDNFTGRKIVQAYDPDVENHPFFKEGN